MKLKIKVHANCSREKIKKLSEKEYEIWIKAKPVDGKANLALEKFLKKELGFKKLKVISGFSSRNKIVETFEN
jgi:uncharacterized protein (TIGR00251 family)